MVVSAVAVDVDAMPVFPAIGPSDSDGTTRLVRVECVEELRECPGGRFIVVKSFVNDSVP